MTIKNNLLRQCEEEDRSRYSDGDKHKKRSKPRVTNAGETSAKGLEKKGPDSRVSGERLSGQSLKVLQGWAGQTSRLVKLCPQDFPLITAAASWP